MGEVRRRPELLVDEAIPARLADLDPGRRAPLARGKDGRGDRPLRPRMGHAGHQGAELVQEPETLLSYRGEVARDAAVVADELARVGLRVGHVRRVDERPLDLAAR